MRDKPFENTRQAGRLGTRRLATRLRAFVSAPILVLVCILPAPGALAQHDDEKRSAQFQSVASNSGSDSITHVAEANDTATRLVGPLRVTIAAVSLADGSKLRPKKRERRWRTSFGSERRTNRLKRLSRTSLEADVIAVRGVTDLSVLRRAFPSTEYFVVLSRQLARAAIENRRSESPLSLPMTAIAVRRAARLRVVQMAHLDFTTGGRPSQGDPGGASSPSNASADDAREQDREALLREAPAAIAVRIAALRKSFWLVNADLPNKGCIDDASLCIEPDPRIDRLSKWMSRLARGSFDTVAFTTGRGGTSGPLAPVGGETAQVFAGAALLALAEAIHVTGADGRQRLPPCQIPVLSVTRTAGRRPGPEWTGTLHAVRLAREIKDCAVFTEAVFPAIRVPVLVDDERLSEGSADLGGRAAAADRD